MVWYEIFADDVTPDQLSEAFLQDYMNLPTRYFDFRNKADRSGNSVSGFALSRNTLNLKCIDITLLSFVEVRAVCHKNCNMTNLHSVNFPSFFVY